MKNYTIAIFFNIAALVTFINAQQLMPESSYDSFDDIFELNIEELMDLDINTVNPGWFGNQLEQITFEPYLHGYAAAVRQTPIRVEGVEAVREMLRGNKTGVVVQDTFVKNAVITEIGEKLEGLEDMRLSSVKDVLNEYHLDETVLKHVGYEVAWTTLDMESAVVRKIHVDDGTQSW